MGWHSQGYMYNICYYFTYFTVTIIIPGKFFKYDDIYKNAFLLYNIWPFYFYTFNFHICWKKINRLIVPYYFFVLLGNVILFIVYHIDDTEFVYTSPLFLAFTENSHKTYQFGAVWFLISLFVVYIIFLVIKKISKGIVYKEVIYTDNIGDLVPPVSVFWYRQFTLSDFSYRLSGTAPDAVLWNGGSAACVADEWYRLPGGFATTPNRSLLSRQKSCIDAYISIGMERMSPFVSNVKRQKQDLY